MEEEEVEVAPPPVARRGLVRVSSLRVRNAVLHDLTAADGDDDDNAAIRIRCPSKTNN